MATLHQDLRAAGVPLDSHESDLYCKGTPEARAIFQKHKQPISSFVSQVDGKVWYEAAFRFDPFWERKP